MNCETFFRMINFRSVLFLTIFFEIAISEHLRDNSTAKEFGGNRATKLLSRQKRFLTFPDGSSLQLVFCVQTAAIIPIGDIFLYGNTAALAWNLPSDPTFFDHLKEKERAQRRGDVVKRIGYVDENGRLLAKVPYKRRPIVNPAFAKRSTDEDQLSFKEKLKLKLDRIKMHQKQSNRDFLRRDGLDDKSIEFHRNSRVELYGKIERLLSAVMFFIHGGDPMVALVCWNPCMSASALDPLRIDLGSVDVSQIVTACTFRLGRDGRQCVLYKLCESAQRSEQGSFIQEFLRAVFTLPKGYEFYEDYHREYDQAHSETTDCVTKYPGCVNTDIPSQL